MADIMTARASPVIWLVLTSGRLAQASTTSSGALVKISPIPVLVNLDALLVLVNLVALLVLVYLVPLLEQ